MIAWLQAFLGFPPPSGIPSIANRLLFCCLSATVRRCRSRREPVAYIKRKAESESIGYENFKSYQTL
jgi:hypothetical protein